MFSFSSRLESVLKDAPNIEEEEKKAKSKISKINQKRVQLAREYKADVEVPAFITLFIILLLVD